jgi:hypothetical protein
MGNCRWSSAEDILLGEHYRTAEWEDLRKLLRGRTDDAIKIRAQKKGLSRPHRIRHSIDMSLIDSEEKAYVLGFFGADASIDKSMYRVELVASEKDCEILFQIKDAVGEGHVGKYYKTHSTYKQNYYYYRLVIYGKEFCGDLCRHGIIPNKTFILKPPSNILKTMVPHYIRGYLEGDGSIGFTNCNYTDKNGFRRNWKMLEISIVSGSYAILEYILAEFNKYCSHTKSPSRHKNIWGMRFVGAKALKFINWVYQDASLSMVRKCDIAMSALSRCDKFGRTGYVSYEECGGKK